MRWLHSHFVPVPITYYSSLCGNIAWGFMMYHDIYTHVFLLQEVPTHVNEDVKRAKILLKSEGMWMKMIGDRKP